MKVLIIGFACSPRLGGEPSNAWNWGWQLSRRHQVWLLAHPHDRDSVEEFLAKHPNPNLKFHWVTVPRLLDLWDHRGSNIGLAVHYLMWLKLAHRKAMNLHSQIDFHLVHHVSYGTVNAPPPFWKLPVPFVWGPVGGAQGTPSSFRRYFGSSSSREILRSVRVATLPLSFSLRMAARSSALVLATNHEIARLYKSADAFLFTSLRDSFGTQVLEAMGHGLPILTLDHQGVGTFVPPEAGIKVPVTSPEQTLPGLAEGIRRLALFPEERRKMGEAALAFAKTQTWEKRAERMSELYEEVLRCPNRNYAGFPFSGRITPAV